MRQQSHGCTGGSGGERTMHTLGGIHNRHACLSPTYVSPQSRSSMRHKPTHSTQVWRPVHNRTANLLGSSAHRHFRFMQRASCANVAWLERGQDRARKLDVGEARGSSVEISHWPAVDPSGQGAHQNHQVRRLNRKLSIQKRFFILDRLSHFDAIFGDGVAPHECRIPASTPPG